MKTPIRILGIAGNSRHDLSSDVHEDNDLFYTDLTCGWVTGPALKLIGEYERSIREYPNIKMVRISPGTRTRESEVALLNHELNLHPDRVALRAYMGAGIRFHF